jgi:uncharacterized membrane protein YbhN (UPF0104 family)
VTAGRVAGALAQAGVGLGLLAALWAVVGGEAVLARLASLDPAWLAAGVALSVPQVALSAWRWRYTAGRLGQPIGYGTALYDYYLSTFLNQVLPGAVLGDGVRAWRHRARAGAAAHWAPAVRAVALERASGQALLLAWLAVTLPLSPLAEGRGPATAAATAALLGLAAAVALGGGRRPAPPRQRGRLRAAAATLGADTRRALLAHPAWLVQGALSAAILATCLATFYCAGRALGLHLDPRLVATVVPAVLLAMLVPVSIAGWGVRDGAAAALWALAGLSAADGAAASIVYGLMVLAGSLPGAPLALAAGRTAAGAAVTHPA